MSNHVIIVGGGLSGLACARRLHREGVASIVLEAADHPGGRVWSDEVEGFVIDRGFQVYLDAYPEGSRKFDLEKLNLHAFKSGALVMTDKGLKRIADPMRDPLHALDTILSGAFTPGDMWRVLKLRKEARFWPQELPGANGKTATIDFLKNYGFSDRAIERFFRPFFSGVFLESELTTAASFFTFVFQMFSTGSATLPEGGMRALPQQLADRLLKGTLKTSTSVRAVRDDGVTLEDGTEMSASAVVLATDASTMARLLDVPAEEVAWQSTTAVSYAADTPPVREPILVLNGRGKGRVNNVVVPSNAAPGYAQEGQSQIMVTLLGAVEEANDQLDHSVREELAGWFGSQVQDWRHLKTQFIQQALPSRFGTEAPSALRSAAKERGITLAGDVMDCPSINGALLAGRHAAEAVMERMAR
jgi:phytoene dehydrogenase-like protein